MSRPQGFYFELGHLTGEAAYLYHDRNTAEVEMFLGIRKYDVYFNKAEVYWHPSKINKPYTVNTLTPVTFAPSHGNRNGVIPTRYSQ